MSSNSDVRFVRIREFNNSQPTPTLTNRNANPTAENGTTLRGSLAMRPLAIRTNSQATILPAYTLVAQPQPQRPASPTPSYRTVASTSNNPRPPVLPLGNNNNIFNLATNPSQASLLSYTTIDRYPPVGTVSTVIVPDNSINHQTQLSSLEKTIIYRITQKDVRKQVITEKDRLDLIANLLNFVSQLNDEEKLAINRILNTKKITKEDRLDLIQTFLNSVD